MEIGEEKYNKNAANLTCLENGNKKPVQLKVRVDDSAIRIYIYFGDGP
ncbi:hypothetical protein SOASR032_31100 [Pragia fontium]|uniref:Uncharacterized protein n=2 Tax=Pragia fontium TaxID=82985 RepID=A0AAJ5BIF6_9GAMM|nr:hypothetical protein SOASR032_31100 [Pragia fontium]SFD34074.1 hypothetical protein SAMN02745723_11415 [Pragia fontium DSM 5563 = ATCC 49100]VEJ57064.1 Uncharacterised protein [Pragia fontium]